MKKIPIVLCIDVEPDERAIDPHVPKDWEGFEKTYEFFRKLRPRLEAATCSPVHYSWFFRMDPQITHTYGDPAWVVTRYRELIEEFKLAGDELGLHTHAWRWDEASSYWIADMGNQEWVEHCVRMSFEAFRESLNRPCLSFRFGDSWINNATVDLIERLGARFDLTVEPGHKRLYIEEPFSGSAPDYTRVPRQPYRPSKVDFRDRGVWRKRDVWIIPLSTGNIDLALTPLKRNRAKTTSLFRNPGASPARERARSAIINPDSVYEGFLDCLDCHRIAGWAYDANRPDKPVAVEIYDGQALLATIPADSFRPDLLIAGKGNGKHSFNLSFPGWLKDGKRHLFRVKIAGSNFELGYSPQEIDCRDGDAEFVTLILDSDSSVISRIMDTLLGARKIPYLALAVRSDAVIKQYRQFNLEQNCSYLLSHPLVKRFVFETPAELIKRVE